MRLRLQQKENRSRIIQENDEDSQRRSDSQSLATSDETNSDLLWEMRNEMDELGNAIKGKTDRSLDRWLGQQIRLLQRQS